MVRQWEALGRGDSAAFRLISTFQVVEFCLCPRRHTEGPWPRWTEGSAPICRMGGCLLTGQLCVQLGVGVVLVLK
jgi:hypothetical protein